MYTESLAYVHGIGSPTGSRLAKDSVSLVPLNYWSEALYHEDGRDNPYIGHGQYRDLRASILERTHN